MSKDIISIGRIAERIRHVRGENVLLGSDLNRNQDRFSSDFVFQLTTEAKRFIFQIGRSKGRGGRRHRPPAFMEQGVAMLSSVLNSDRAIRVNIAIMRVFVKLRQTLETNRELAQNFSELE